MSLYQVACSVRQLPAVQATCLRRGFHCSQRLWTALTALGYRSSSHWSNRWARKWVTPSTSHLSFGVLWQEVHGHLVLEDNRLGLHMVCSSLVRWEGLLVQLDKSPVLLEGRLLCFLAEHNGTDLLLLLQSCERKHRPPYMHWYRHKHTHTHTSMYSAYKCTQVNNYKQQKYSNTPNVRISKHQTDGARHFAMNDISMTTRMS